MYFNNCLTQRSTSIILGYQELCVALHWHQVVGFERPIEKVDQHL